MRIHNNKIINGGKKVHKSSGCYIGLKQMTRAELLGRKTGKGYYDWKKNRREFAKWSLSI